MKLMKNIIFTLLMFVFLIGLVFITFAQESSPQLPHLFYGTAKVDSSDLPTGSVIIAKVSNAEKGRITTTSAGKYGGPSGSENKLVVQGNIAENAQIEFFVSTIKANEVAQFKSAKIENKNLTWTFPDEIEFDGELANVPYTCVPGTNIEVDLNGLTLILNCSTSKAGTLKNISILDAPTSGAIAVFPASNISTFYEISILGDVEIIVTISYNDAGIDESTVRPYRFVGGVWTPVPDSDIISRDTAANKITFKISPGGTPYTAFGSAPTPAAPSPTGAAAAAGGGGGGGCTYDWQCTAWSACQPNGKQTRTCTNRGTCVGDLGKPAEVQDCVYTAPAKEEEKEEAPLITPPEDICPNIEGIQTRVPEGMVKNADGNCVAAPPAPTGFAALTGALITDLKNPVTWIGIIVAVLVLAALYAGYYYLYKKKKNQ